MQTIVNTITNCINIHKDVYFWNTLQNFTYISKPILKTLKHPQKRRKNFFVRSLRALAPLPKGATPCKIF